jgi:hypothetical protein
LLQVMARALDAAFAEKYGAVDDEIAARGARTLMAMALMDAVDTGERGPERLKLAGLCSVDGRIDG